MLHDKVPCDFNASINIFFKIDSFTITHSTVLLFLRMNKANIPYYGKWKSICDDGPDARG